MDDLHAIVNSASQLHAMIEVQRHQDVHAVSSFEYFINTGGRQSQQSYRSLQGRRLRHKFGLPVELSKYGSVKIPLPNCDETWYCCFA